MDDGTGDVARRGMGAPPRACGAGQGPPRTNHREEHRTTTIETMSVNDGYRETLRALVSESDEEVEIEVSADMGTGTVYVDVAGAGPVALDIDQALLYAAALFAAVRVARTT